MLKQIMVFPCTKQTSHELFTLKAPITIAADGIFGDIFSNFGKKLGQAGDSHEIIMPYLLFFKKQQNLKLSSAENYRWRFMG